MAKQIIWAPLARSKRAEILHFWTENNKCTPSPGSTTLVSEFLTDTLPFSYNNSGHLLVKVFLYLRDFSFVILIASAACHPSASPG